MFFYVKEIIRILITERLSIEHVYTCLTVKYWNDLKRPLLWKGIAFKWLCILHLSSFSFIFILGCMLTCMLLVFILIRFFILSNTCINCMFTRISYNGSLIPDLFLVFRILSAFHMSKMICFILFSVNTYFLIFYTSSI